MDTQCARSKRFTHKCCRYAVLPALLLPLAAFASGAREGVTAKPGEIVVLRNVATRAADRPPVSPGMALLVDPSPLDEIDNALGLGKGELSNADYAGLNAGPRDNERGAGGSSMQRSLNQHAIGSANNRITAAVAGNGISNIVTGSMGAIGGATEDIGNQISGSVSQIPMPGAAGSGH